jgi:hypothetical protein
MSPCPAGPFWFIFIIWKLSTWFLKTYLRYFSNNKCYLSVFSSQFITPASSLIFQSCSASLRDHGRSTLCDLSKEKTFVLATAAFSPIGLMHTSPWPFTFTVSICHFTCQIYSHLCLLQCWVKKYPGMHPIFFKCEFKVGIFKESRSFTWKCRCSDLLEITALIALCSDSRLITNSWVHS